jgi:hypothetical protein
MAKNSEESLEINYEIFMGLVREIEKKVGIKADTQPTLDSHGARFTDHDGQYVAEFTYEDRMFWIRSMKPGEHELDIMSHQFDIADPECVNKVAAYVKEMLKDPKMLPFHWKNFSVSVREVVQ